jgi:hypothetical protein
VRVLQDRPVEDAAPYLDAEESFVVSRDGELVRVEIFRDGDRDALAWGLGASEFDAAFRAVLALCPDHVEDFPEFGAQI